MKSFFESHSAVFLIDDKADIALRKNFGKFATKLTNYAVNNRPIVIITSNNEKSSRRCFSLYKNFQR